MQHWREFHFIKLNCKWKGNFFFKWKKELVNIRGEKIRPKIPLSAYIRSYAKMEIESTGSHQLHELDNIISPCEVILNKQTRRKLKFWQTNICVCVCVSCLGQLHIKSQSYPTQSSCEQKFIAPVLSLAHAHSKTHKFGSHLLHLPCSLQSDQATSGITWK